ncbi:MAG: nucleoside-diphosphate kinase [archaeon]
MAQEKTLVILKPDTVNRGLVGAIIGRFEKKGLKIVAIKMEQLREELLKEHYGHHEGRPFFAELIKFMSSIPSVLLVLEGHDAVAVVRKMCGATSGRSAEVGTIRGDYSMSIQVNTIHASENVDEAAKEIKRFFAESEILGYKKMDFDWVYSFEEKK